MLRVVQGVLTPPTAISLIPRQVAIPNVLTMQDWPCLLFSKLAHYFT